MPETNESKSFASLFTMLVLLLVAVVAIQTWYIVDIKQTLDTMQSDQSSSQPAVQPGAEAVTTSESNNTVDSSENEEALVQSQPVKQKSPSDEKDITADNLVPPVPPASAPPALADDEFFYMPPHMQPWNPHEEMQRMQQHMERSFNDRYYPPDYNRPDFSYRFRQNISAPEMDMREDQNQYIVLVNIPGAEQKDISVKLDGQRLTVMGKQEYKNQDRDANGNIIFSERRSGKFKRSITLRAPVEKKGMQTQIDNGVVRILIPKKKYPG